MNKSEKKLVVITQPDFLPWLGSFDKYVKADVFVFLNDVMNRTSDGIWTKRVKILMNGEAKWLTVPLKKPETEFIPINQMEIDLDSNFKKKHIATIENNYKKTPFFKEVFSLIERYYEHDSPRVAERNVSFFLDVMDAMGVKKEIHYSSDMKLETKRNELLIDIVKRAGGNSYLYGGGSVGYLDFDLWSQNEIELVPQNFIHPQYLQLNSKVFVPGLSIIDALCNIGLTETKRLFNI